MSVKVTSREAINSKNDCNGGIWQSGISKETRLVQLGKTLDFEMRFGSLFPQSSG